MASRRRRIISALTAWLAGNLLWSLVGPGAGLAVSAAITAVVDIAQPWRSFLFVGLGMVVAGLVLGVVRPLVAARLQETPPDSAQIEAKRRAEDARVAIHEVLTTLERHKADIQRWTKARSPQYRGQWLTNRELLSRDARYDRAVRATERAFQDIPYFVGAAALESVEEAISEWERLLESE